MNTKIRYRYVSILFAALGLLTFLAQPYVFADDDDHIPARRIRQGFDIAPVPLDLRDKNPALVGLGSYIVNAQGACNDCHTVPPHEEGGDPFQGEPEKINTAHYLAGGRVFEAFEPDLVSPNLTPDANGNPGGLTREEFIQRIRTGRDPRNPDYILQVMPWFVYGKMTDRDLRAVYEYLRAIPPAEPGASQ